MMRLPAAALGPSARVNAVAPALTETPWTQDDPFFRHRGPGARVHPAAPRRPTRC
ncbi:hypothetical protein [Streptomyces sp. NPDC001508]|uniref:hypothetical protein n=1 Tax=Streptomyces sp. NPDC001508 TaxID=3154656 RepID=UPI003331D1A4